MQQTERRRTSRLRAFTLIELLVVIAIIALLIGILLPALGEARRLARMTIDIANEKQISTATHSYGADYEDTIFAFTFEAGETYLIANESTGVLEAEVMPPNDLDAAAIQATDIVRRRADRIGAASIPVPGAWIPHVLYTHLVVQDYLASRLPEPLVVNPADKVRLNWQIDPVEKFDNGFWLPLQPDPSNPDYWRWPYSSSYQTVPASYDLYQSDFSADAPGRRIYQASTHSGYWVPGNCQLGDLSLSKVAHASGKVHLQQTHQRHFGDNLPFYGLPQARIPLAFFDGSVSVKRTADGNAGWRPPTPMFPCMIYNYQPDTWEPPTTEGDFSEVVKGYYRWTRGGLLGVDFGGHPLDTGQPGDIDGECDL